MRALFVTSRESVENLGLVFFRDYKSIALAGRRLLRSAAAAAGWCVCVCVKFSCHTRTLTVPYKAKQTNGLSEEKQGRNGTDSEFFPREREGF